MYPGSSNSIFSAIRQGAHGDPARSPAWWSYGGDYGYVFAIYYEAEVIDPDYSHTMYFAMAQLSQLNLQQGGYAYQQVNWVSKPSTTLSVKGFYDSPGLDPKLFGVPEGEELPKGMKLVGHFEKDGKIIKNVQVQDGENCITYTEGNIDFSADNLPQLWKNLGQNAGRQFVLPNDVQITSYEEIYFKFDIYDSPALDKKVSFTKSNDINLQDRMQDGYLPVKRADGSIVPVKVKYYLDRYDYNPRARSYKVRVRPFVLPDYDPALPLNPVAISPYRNIVRWLKFDGASSTSSSPIQKGQTLTREIIPNFLTLKCEVKDITSRAGMSTPFDTWAPGYYFEDGGPWMVGDNQFVGIHQRNDGDANSITFSCWGEQTDPNTGSKVTEVPVNGFVMMDAESTDGGSGSNEYLKIKMNGTDQNTKYYPITGYSSCNALAVKELHEIDPSLQIKSVPGVVKTLDNGALQFLNPQGRCGPVNNSQNGAIFGPALMAVAPVDVEQAKKDNKIRQEITVEMKGNGKQALAVGVVLAGDTSNANYNNNMPPVLQYSSLGFYGGLNDEYMDTSRREYRDWTLPSNYNHNYYYYGSRLG